MLTVRVRAVVRGYVWELYDAEDGQAPVERSSEIYSGRKLAKEAGERAAYRRFKKGSEATSQAED
jgi:hypothetical protein